jgi:HTH-type transcriptional regulator/antitoxin MqsA
MDRIFKAEVMMFKCHVCGSTQARAERVNEVFRIDGQLVLVENIPALVCRRCGEIIFSRETAEAVRKLVRGQGKPVKSVRLDVFAYA